MEVDFPEGAEVAFGRTPGRVIDQHVMDVLHAEKHAEILHENGLEMPEKEIHMAP